MSMTSASNQYFEKNAHAWDDLRSGYFHERVREAAIARAYLRPGMTAADVGAGTGFISAGLAPLVRKVHLLDGSAAMLDVARQNLAAFDHIEYHHAEGLALPLEDHSVDVVFANMYLHHCVQPLDAIREMVRILKPGGRLVLTDVDTHTHTWMIEELADVWLGFERSQVRDWFRQAGLVNVIVDCTGESCCVESNFPAPEGAPQSPAENSVFVAVGTQRLVMRDAVQAAYSQVAQTGYGCGSSSEASSDCCGEPTSACCESSAARVPLAYSFEDLTGVPEDAAGFSLGCGNPIALANLRPGEVALDIGSGGGLDSFLAARRVAPGGKVIGVDMTPAMLERARAAAAKAGIRNVEFRQGQAEALPAANASVDVVLSNCVINLCEDKGEVFREAFRVLKPGGRLEVSDMTASGSVPLEQQTNTGEWAACLTGALPQQEYLDLITQAGFDIIQTRRSAVAKRVGDVDIHSIIVSARKPGMISADGAGSPCGCQPGCCG